jgi:hypothetical protein
LNQTAPCRHKQILNPRPGFCPVTSPTHKLLISLVPGEGFEPPTFGLQNRCTTTVLTRQKFLVAMTCISWIARPPARDASGKESQEEFGQRCARGERGDHLRRNFGRPWAMGSDSKLSQGNARTPAPANRRQAQERNGDEADPGRDAPSWIWEIFWETLEPCRCG